MPDSEAENTRDLKKLVILMQNGRGHMVKRYAEIRGGPIKYGRSGNPKYEYSSYLEEWVLNEFVFKRTQESRLKSKESHFLATPLAETWFCNFLDQTTDVECQVLHSDK